MSVLDQFLIEKIVPEILDEAPKQLLKVYYPSGVFVNGSELKPVQVKNQPNVEWEAGEDFFYTLLMAGKQTIIIKFHYTNYVYFYIFSYFQRS